MASELGLRKGDACYVVGSFGRYASTVKSVGRKYITVKNGTRFTLGGWGDYGKHLYRSREHYEETIARAEAWRKLRYDMPHTPHASVSTADILAAIALVTPKEAT